MSQPDMLAATVLADVSLILIAGSALGAAARRVGQPRVVGEILAGIALGPSVLGLLPGHWSDRLFPADARPILNAIAQLGLALFMFTIGWEFDLEQMRHRATRFTAGLVSVGSVGVAFGSGVALAAGLYAAHSTVHGHHIAFTPFALFLGTAMSITAFPVLARVLRDRGWVGSRVGTLSLASAAVDDILAWCTLAVVAALAGSHDTWQFARMAAWTAVFVAVMALVVRPALRLLVCRTVRDQAQYQLFVLLAAGIFLSGYATTWIGIHAIFGAFAFGMAMPRKPEADLDEQLHKPLELTGSLLLPVFFIVTGLGVDVRSLSGRGVLELAAVVAVAVAGKLAGTLAAARVLNLPWRQSAALGLLMNMRGLTELIILNVGVSLGVLDTSIFTAMVLMALTTTAMAVPLLKGFRIETAAASDPEPALARPRAAALTH
ncbi:Kef-type K+ transport system membrane component KefB [Catenulispora sp. GAS73]|uniref:cation:proton antiporter n=1 Tax=Catenulispora sp. GAS73 TaxID=3156269 RepID=UPI0035136591